MKTWMEENQFKMKDTETEVIVIGKSYNLKKNILDNIKIGKTKFTKHPKLSSLE